MVVNQNPEAWDRMYDDYYCSSSPHLCWDGGEQIFHGTPSGEGDYEPGLLTSCDRPIEPVFLSMSVEWRGGDQVEISLAVRVTDPGGVGCCDIRGDIDHNGADPEISDLVYLVDFMFAGGAAPPCEDPEGSGYFPEADIDAEGAGPDISDLVALVQYMFLGCSECLVPCPGQ